MEAPYGNKPGFVQQKGRDRPEYPKITELFSTQAPPLTNSPESWYCPPMETRLETLEVKVSYQDKIIEELNQVIIEQQKQIDILMEYFKSLEKDDKTSNLVDISLEVPPPHY